LGLHVLFSVLGFSSHTKVIVLQKPNTLFGTCFCPSDPLAFSQRQVTNPVGATFEIQ